ncbi:hypothetical protein CALCODRAFT_485926, partial [Calocera cornea HHB12733]
MAATITAVGGCYDWHATDASSRIRTCCIALPQSPASGNLAGLLQSDDILGILHYFLPRNSPEPDIGVYSITAKIANSKDQLVVGSAWNRDEFHFELHCLSLLPLEHQKLAIPPIINLSGPAVNINGRTFDMDLMPYISTAKKHARFRCYFPEEGRFFQSAPNMNANAMVCVTGTLIGEALQGEGSAEPARLSVRILEMDYLASSSTTSALSTAVTPSRSR